MTGGKKERKRIRALFRADRFQFNQCLPNPSPLQLSKQWEFSLSLGGKNFVPATQIKTEFIFYLISFLTDSILWFIRVHLCWLCTFFSDFFFLVIILRLKSCKSVRSSKFLSAQSSANPSTAQPIREHSTFISPLTFSANSAYPLHKCDSESLFLPSKVFPAAASRRRNSFRVRRETRRKAWCKIDWFDRKPSRTERGHCKTASNATHRAQNPIFAEPLPASTLIGNRVRKAARSDDHRVFKTLEIWRRNNCACSMRWRLSTIYSG